MVGQGAAVLGILASPEQPKIVVRDPLFARNLDLDILNRVRRLDFEGEDPLVEEFDEDLHRGCLRGQRRAWSE